jgi:hypothetical protein
MDKYVLVTWPESQMLMEEEWFDTECILMNDENHLEEIGSSAFFVPQERYEEFVNKNK